MIQNYTTTSMLKLLGGFDLQNPTTDTNAWAHYQYQSPNQALINVRSGNQTIKSKVEIRHWCQKWESDIDVRMENQTLMLEVRIKYWC